MIVYYRPYKLSPISKLNRLSSEGIKRGVHFKVYFQNENSFGDYFPHEELGDQSIEEFLETFKFQSSEYSKKIFHFLQNDHRLRNLRPEKFFNHILFTHSVCADSSECIKYKIKEKNDYKWEEIGGPATKIRLDANGLFSRDEIISFLEGRSSLKRIEYIEDPSYEIDWSSIPVKTARDFIHGLPFTYYIHKSSARFAPENMDNVIFSSYMGSNLGTWQTYCELLEIGNLNQVHGIITPDLYPELRNLFKGNFQTGFFPCENEVKSMYKELNSGEWKTLCSI